MPYNLRRIGLQFEASLESLGRLRSPRSPHSTQAAMWPQGTKTVAAALSMPHLGLEVLGSGFTGSRGLGCFYKNSRDDRVVVTVLHMCTVRHTRRFWPPNPKPSKEDVVILNPKPRTQKGDGGCRRRCWVSNPKPKKETLVVRTQNPKRRC